MIKMTNEGTTEDTKLWIPQNNQTNEQTTTLRSYSVKFQNQSLPKFLSGDPVGAISFCSKGCDPKFSFLSSKSAILLWRYFNSVSRHLSLDSGNSFALQYTAESEFRRLLSTWSVVAPPKSSKTKRNNDNYKSDIISAINLHFKGKPYR